MSTNVTTQNKIPEGKDLKITFAPSTLSSIRAELGPDVSLYEYTISVLTEDPKLAPFSKEISAIVNQQDDVVFVLVSKVSNNDLRSNLRTALASLFIEYEDEIGKVELIDRKASKSTAASHFDTYKWWYIGGGTALAIGITAAVVMRNRN